MTMGIVLSGGGAKGSFQVGALRFLYDGGVRPDIICGCSVGAINGAKLAEGEGLPTQGLQGLERIWLGLRSNDDMFRREEWLNQAHPIVRDTVEASGGDAFDASALTGGDYTAWGDLAWLARNVERAALSLAAALSAGEIVRNLELIGGAQALYNLDPIGWRLRGNLERSIPKSLNIDLVNQWAGTGKRLRLAVVSLESGTLRYVTEQGHLLERDNYTPVTVATEKSAACAPLEGELNALVSERTLEQQDLQGAAGSTKTAVLARIAKLNAKIADKTAALEECQQLNPPQRRQAAVDLPTGVLASASIPALFRAVTMEGETYVDGGVREVLPLQAAVDLGASVIYAVSASRPDVVPAASFKDAHMFTILGRALVDLSINEVAQNDEGLMRPGHSRVTSIQPTFDVHEMTHIEPGFIRVAMGYGYMRASDVVTGSNLEEKGRQNWIDDTLPGSASPKGDEPWTWVAADPKPLSGNAAHSSSLKGGIHQHFFENATPMQVHQHDVLFAHVWLSSEALPAQLMLQWNDGSWEHRAYWGQNRIGWGTDGSHSRRYMGPLPQADRWVRLDIPAASVGLEGRGVHGMAFTLFDGRAVWDVAGRRPGIVSRGRSSSDSITRLRQQLRAEEMEYFASPTPTLLKVLQERKRQVRALVRERLQLGLDVPPHIEKSWMNWEWFAPAGQADQPWPAAQGAPVVPAACRSIENLIHQLEEERTLLQADLQEAAGSQKASVVAQIAQVNAQIDKREAELKACIQEHTPSPTLDPVRHGLLLQGAGPQIFLLYGGSKLWIRSMSAFNGMGFQSGDVLRVPDDVLARLPLDRPVDGTLVAAKGDPKVYVMEGGKRRWVTSPTVLDRDAASWDNSWPHIRQLPPDTLAGIPAGPNLS